MDEKISSLKKNIRDNTAEFVKWQHELTACKAMAPENGGEGEIKKCEQIEMWLKSHGITNLQRFDAPDSRVPCGFRPNLVATIDGENNDYALWIIAHMDVVPAGDLNMWQSNPWQVIEKDGRLYGRGVEDDQQGLVSAVAAALAFVKNGIVPAHTVKLLFMADEEVGRTYGI